MPNAYSIKVRGVVQGVGFRPFVYRLACANDLKGWVLNAEEGVEIDVPSIVQNDGQKFTYGGAGCCAGSLD